MLSLGWYLLHVETFDRGKILLARKEGLKQHQCQRDMVFQGVCQIFYRFRVQGSKEKRERERSMISNMAWEIFSVIDLQELKKYYEISTVNIWYLCC